MLDLALSCLAVAAKEPPKDPGTGSNLTIELQWPVADFYPVPQRADPLKAETRASTE
jgi:hypothetical protein